MGLHRQSKARRRYGAAAQGRTRATGLLVLVERTSRRHPRAGCLADQSRLGLPTCDYVHDIEQIDGQVPVENLKPLQRIVQAIPFHL